MLRKPLKIITSPELNVFFSSDWHLDHLGPKGSIPLWHSRGYKSVSDMTDGIIQKINETVKSEDIIFNLGDFCLNSSDEKFELYLSKINCQNIYYINGNHNSVIKNAYKKALELEIGRSDIEAYPVGYKNLTFLGNYTEVQVDDAYICMCHFPIDVFNHGLHGAFMLCGHSHGNYEKTRPEYKYNKRLDVSWDIHHKPISIKEVKDIMSKKEFIAADHHGE